MKTLYTAEALATGAGRNGHVHSSDGLLDLDLAIPTEMGGRGGAPNPELLFAAGYAACFHSALQLVARQAKHDIKASSVQARVGIGQIDGGGFGLSVSLAVSIPGLDRESAQRLADRAHEVCPYSNATRGNIDVTVTVVSNA